MKGDNPEKFIGPTLLLGALIWGYLSCEKTKIHPVTTRWVPSLLRPGYKIKLSSLFIVNMEFPFIESLNPLHTIFMLVFLLQVNLYLVPSVFRCGIDFLGQMRILEIITPLLHSRGSNNCQVPVPL